MRNQQADPAVRPSSTWEKFSNFCLSNPLGSFLNNCASGVCLMLISHFLGFWKFFGLEGRHVQERRRREELKRDSEKTSAAVRECLDLIEAINTKLHKSSILAEGNIVNTISESSEARHVEHEEIPQAATTAAVSSLCDPPIQPWLNPNSCAQPCTPREEGPQESSSASSQGATDSCQPEVGTWTTGLDYDPLLNITGSAARPGRTPEAYVIVYIPDGSATPAVKIADLIQNTPGSHTLEVVVRGSRILQSKVQLRDDVLANLHGLADACTQVDGGISVQVSDCRMFIRTDGVQMVRLEDTHDVPIILYSAYAAGRLTIEGLNLENATLKAATFSNSITLEKFEKKQVLNGVEVCTWIVQLPSNDLEEVFVYATKTIAIENQEVLVCSSIVKIQDNNLKSVVRIGVPSTLLIIYIARQLLHHDGARLINLLSNLGPDLQWMVSLLIIILCQLMPPRVEVMIGARLERVRLIIFTLFFSAWNFLFKKGLGFPSGVDTRRRLKQEKEALDGEATKCANQGFLNYFVETEPGKLLVETISQMNQLLTLISKSFLDAEDSVEGSENPPDVVTERKSIEMNPNWQWQVSEECQTKSGHTRLRKCDGADRKDRSLIFVTSEPFEVIFGLKNKLWAERDYVNIFSSLLMDVITLSTENTYDFSVGKVKIYASQLFHIRGKLREISFKGVDVVFPGNAPASKEEREIQQLHVDYLLRYMEKELEDIEKRYVVLESRRHVSFDMLWAFFSPKTQLVYHCEVTDEEVCGIVTTTLYDSDDEGPFFRIIFSVWDYNCSTWKPYRKSRCVRLFVDVCNFTSLQEYPLRFARDPEQIMKAFLEKGEVFCNLTMRLRNCYMNYKGLVYIWKKANNCLILSKETADGRVMVDLGSFAKMKPDYRMGNAEPPCEVLRDNNVVLKDVTLDPTRMYAPAMVYGFSFGLKEWGTFQVCGFRDIHFNKFAFDALVMPSKKKELVYKLVREYIPRANKGDSTSESEGDTNVGHVDPIVSKGEGCIFLCYGPPGTGKTLTAESIAESLEAPLWSLTVSELGTSPDQLESHLVKILNVASTWGAILLLDEADVYLEKRSSFDLIRNAMTGIFLRNLEYYSGVIFLTTNRIVAFDEAFLSRISMILYYEVHKSSDRLKIWRSTLDRVGMKDIPDDLLDEASSKELNGRDIRNVVHKATVLAKSNGNKLTRENIQQSLDDALQSMEELKSVTSQVH